MKAQICALSALAMIGFVPHGAAAADLGGYDGGYEERGAVIEGPPVVRRYYDEGPVVAYYGPRYYRPYPYYAGYYPYRWGPRYWYGPHYGYGYGYGHRGWGHRGWR